MAVAVVSKLNPDWTAAGASQEQFTWWILWVLFVGKNSTSEFDCIEHTSVRKRFIFVAAPSFRKCNNSAEVILERQCVSDDADTELSGLECREQ